MYMVIFMPKRALFLLCVISFLLCFAQRAAGEINPNPGVVQKQTHENEKLNMYAKSYALMDGESGRLLIGEESGEAMANASTTKILTCILALELGDEESVVTVSANAVAQPKVHLGMKTKEQFYMKDLLYGLMLESYNDCAVAIAEEVCGDVESFVQKMNDKALELGCVDTHFVTPNGLDWEDETAAHHTTAEDLCRIMKYCAWDSPKSERFLEITQTRSYTFCDLDGKSFTVNNHNLLLDMMNGVITGKTGYTAKAGYCYVAAMEDNGRRFCIALLACGWPEHKNYKWLDSKKLLGYGTEHYQVYQCEETCLDIDKIPVRGGYKEGMLSEWGNSTTLSLYADNGPDQLSFLKADWDEVIVKKEMKKGIPLPVYTGDVMGKISFWVGEEELFSYDICAGEDLFQWDFESFQNAVLKDFFMRD